MKTKTKLAEYNKNMKNKDHKKVTNTNKQGNKNYQRETNNSE